ncbi:MAG TPA: hypothetical protein VLA34_01660 [Candidatus Krumholzibacterium sp.]|nr:hypothetical protein [Candidatus Krumholzibacterium sp.]
MGGEFVVSHLKCGHCGNELPVMGRFITFQCETCFRYWILTSGGLEPLQVRRAQVPADTDGEILLLPFWVIPLDGDRLRDSVEGSMTALLSEIAHTRVVPSGGELDVILRRIEQRGTYNIFIPAFQSANTFAYLKIGRLLTSRQPKFSATRHETPGQPVMCVLKPEDAVHLMDFVFIATLPESLQRNGGFLENVHLEPSAPPRFVEFPFIRKSMALTSIYGDFEISLRLIESPEQE